MNTFLLVCSMFLAVLIGCTFVTVSVYGWLATEKDMEVTRKAMNNGDLNGINSSIICYRGLGYLSSHFAILSKYHCALTKKCVPRWSPLHKEIEDRFHELRMKQAVLTAN